MGNADAFPHFSSLEPEVPANAELSLEVKLLEVNDAPDLELLPPAERITLASHKRERGNIHYQRGDYAFAVNSYSIALQITESSSKGEIQVMESRLSEDFRSTPKLEGSLACKLKCGLS